MNNPMYPSAEGARAFDRLQLVAHPRYETGDLLAGRYELVGAQFGRELEFLFCHDRDDAKGAPKVLVGYRTGDDPARAKRRFNDQLECWLKIGYRMGPPLREMAGLEELDGKSWAVTEYSPGGTLADRLASGPLTLHDVVRLGAQMAVALDNAAHAVGRPHLRLTPHHFHYGANEFPYLVWIWDAPEKEPEIVAYRSPEQLFDWGSLDVRADMWTYGIILFQALTGRLPYPNTKPELIRAILAGTDLRAELVAAPEPLTDLIVSCLHKDASKRFDDFGAVLQAWDRILALPGGASKPAKEGEPDTRIALEDEGLQVLWRDLYPERRIGVRVSNDMSAINGAFQAWKFRRIGNPALALLAADKVLGQRRDEDSNFRRFFAGTLEVGFEQKTETRSVMRPYPQMIPQVIETMVYSYVDLIEERDDGQAYVPAFVDFTTDIVNAGCRDPHLLALAAQGFLKAERWGDVERIIRPILAEEPGNLRNWWILIVALNNSVGKREFTDFVLREVLPNLGDVESNVAQRVCGKACYMIEDWMQAASFLERAFELDPRDLEAGADACGALLNAGEKRRASICFNRLTEIAPDSRYVKRLARFFESDR